MTAAAKALDALDETCAHPQTHRRPCNECGTCGRKRDAAVNLASPLAAVARAVVHRPWWKLQGFNDDGTPRYRCGCCWIKWEPSKSPRKHDMLCEYETADAALDALEAAARALRPRDEKETT